ncbi:histidine phosphatase family protein [Alkaliphilus hydrothermalis]|uniref:Phosphoglycerate mutase n=1 Tax=Alkaliphilus hydrothermalis TaxID=1482730 RepID=A0ABS2NNE3_9FIRM|nr:putative phosphoglycerate mutase [Alkaliphilus hydrothermalis]
MKKIYLVRHGETNWNIQGRTQGWQDSSLTNEGLRQASLVAERLKWEKIDVVFSSNLKRAKSTAHIIADELNVPCHLTEGLKEMGFGLWEGLTVEEIRQQFPNELDQWHTTPHTAMIPEAEDLIAAQKRMVYFFEEVIQREEENILLVSHGTSIKLLLMFFLGMSMADFYKLKQDNCAINLIEFRQRGPVLIKYNDTSYREILLKGDFDGK